MARGSGCSGRSRGGGSGRLATARCKHPLRHDGAADAASLLNVAAVLVEGHAKVRVASRVRVLPTFVVVMGMLLILYKETPKLLAKYWCEKRRIFQRHSLTAITIITVTGFSTLQSSGSVDALLITLLNGATAGRGLGMKNGIVVVRDRLAVRVAVFVDTRIGRLTLLVCAAIVVLVSRLGIARSLVALADPVGAIMIVKFCGVGTPISHGNECLSSRDA